VKFCGTQNDSVWGYVRPIFGYRLPEVGHFLKSDDIHPANGLRTSSVAALEGYCRQESVTILNRLLLLRQFKEEANQKVGRLFSELEIRHSLLVFGNRL
jgi:hypothetical protein